MSSYIQKSRSLNEIKSIVIKSLIANGFSASIRLEDRKFQLTVLENTLTGLWIALSLITVGSVRNAVIWILIIILALLAEQIVDIIIYRRNSRNQSGGKRFSKRFFLRSLYKRMNIWLAIFLIFFSICFIRLFQFEITYPMFLGVTLFYIQLAVMDNSFRICIKDKLYLLAFGLSEACHLFKKLALVWLRQASY